MGAECSRCRLPPGREAKESAVDAQKQVGPDRGRQHGRGHQANSPGASLRSEKVDLTSWARSAKIESARSSL
jgi:hypothetical protein